MTKSVLRSGRGAQSLRHLKLIRLLTSSREWLSISGLCELLYGRSYRTAYRDVEQLMGIGVPIETREVTENGSTRWEYRLTWARFGAWMREGSKS
jgi:hypothetical protein